MSKLINNGENVESKIKLDVGTDAGQCHKFLGCPLLPSRSDLCMLKGI